jgi:ribonuclease HII
MPEKKKKKLLIEPKRSHVGNMPQVPLSLVEKEKEKILDYLKQYPELKVDEKHILIRVQVQDCVVTLYSSGKLLIQGNTCQLLADQIKEFLGGTGEVLIGVDEVGRGEQEGPFVVAGVLGKNEDLRELRDSKKVKDIGTGYKTALENIQSGLSISFSPGIIDSLRESGMNMNQIQSLATNTIIQSLGGENAKVDGSPLKGIDAVFIVGGDDLIPVISAASVIAKHIRNTSEKKGIRKTWKNIKTQAD